MLRPLLRPSTDRPTDLPPDLPPDLRGLDEWRGHLSLATHELHGQDDLRAEVETFVRQLDVPCPSRFGATTVTVYRFFSPTWAGPWWTTLRWERVTSSGLQRLP